MLTLSGLSGKARLSFWILSFGQAKESIAAVGPQADVQSSRVSEKIS